MNIFKIQDGGRPPFQKLFFDHNSAADSSISVKIICVEMQFFFSFHRISVMG